MGVFSRPDSSFYWLWLEGVRRKEPTKIPVARTADDRTQQRMRRAAERLYATRMAALEEQRDEQETELLRLFRTCSPEQRQQVVQFAATLNGRR